MNWESVERWGNRAQIPLTFGGYVGWAYTLWPKNAVLLGNPKNVSGMAVIATLVLLIGGANLLLPIFRRVAEARARGTASSVKPGVPASVQIKLTPRPGPPNLPLPTAIGPADRKRMIVKLTGLQEIYRKAQKPLLKAQILYAPGPTATYLAEELNTILGEAGWTDAPPKVYQPPGTLPGDVPRGICIYSSLSEPASLAALHLDGLFKEIGIRHNRIQHADLRQHDFCIVSILEFNG